MTWVIPMGVGSVYGWSPMRGNRVELEETLMRTAFFTQLKTLKQELKLSKKSKREQQSNIVQRRRKMRKQTLFTQQHDTAMNDPRLHKHLGLLERLGVDGMFSDESDREDMGPDTSGRMFHIRKPV
ncbi:hypothetical protein BDN71DRAFT_1437133 [Pleurotus eryngii]|uniref:Uncharacterized protein n=1 Tax=Pleurotus eryngii TaxID=5323 RepID=A0A9P6D147_PLEER|nr:hypothetical protein BDN71DRAFT_1437133 [Pleurotus eryngii]